MFRGGGHIVPALQKTCSCSSLFGLRDPKFWYNSYIIVTLDVLNLWNQKCVSKKNWSMFFDAGVKNQKFKNGKMTPKTILYHAHTKNKKLLFSWPCLFRPLFKRYGCYRDFFEFFWIFFWSTLLKNLFFQRLDMKIFEHFLVYFLIWCQKCPLNMFTKGRAHCAPPRNK